MSVDRINLETLEAFVNDVLFSSARVLPVVGVTTRPRSEHPWIAAEELERALGGRATVVLIETGELTWHLSDLLPDRLDVFGGALRIWWPGLSLNSDPYEHPLFLIFGAPSAESARERVIGTIALWDGARSASGLPLQTMLSTPQEASPQQPGRCERDVIVVHVTKIEGRRIFIADGDVIGLIIYADVKLDQLAAQLKVGQSLRVFRAGGATNDGFPRYSTQGLLATEIEPPTHSPAIPAVQVTPAASTQQPSRGERNVVIACVTKIEGRRIFVADGDEIGLIGYADVKLDQLAEQLQVGQSLRVFRVGGAANDGFPRYSTQGLVAVPVVPPPHVPTHDARPSVPRPPPPQAPVTPPSIGEAWRRIEEFYEVGDSVRARIARVEDNYLLVDLLPGATAIVPGSEVSYDRIILRDEFSIGEQVAVQLLSLDSDGRRCEASIKRAYGQELRPAVAPRRGEPAFLGGEKRPLRPELQQAPHSSTPGQGEEMIGREQLERRLAQTEAAHAREQEKLITRLAQAEAQRKMEKEQFAQLRRDKKALEDRELFLRRRYGFAEPLSSETAFLTAVRVEYALRCTEDDRARYPLRRMVVGREFLASARALEGIETDKIVEVCAEVAMGRCHEIPGRDVHPLHAGEGGPPRYRATDGARAWRCSLQNITAGARRLHWWNTGGAPETIEFASVGVHDDFGIPE